MIEATTAVLKVIGALIQTFGPALLVFVPACIVLESIVSHIIKQNSKNRKTKR